MTKLFGIPVDELAVVLLALAVAAFGTVGLLALRNRMFFRMGVRNVRRRPGRSVLIVVGSMLGTAIIAAALATGDTMARTVRSAISALGQADEVVAAKGVATALAAEPRARPDTLLPGELRREDRGCDPRLRSRRGVAPVIVETIAVQDLTTRQNEPRATLFAGDPRDLTSVRRHHERWKGGFALADLKAGEVFLNADAADELGAHAGDSLRILAGTEFITAKVKAIVRYDGGATDGSGLLLPLSEAQRLLDKPGLVKAVFVSNTSGAKSGAKLSGQVIDRMQPTLSQLGLEADNTKEDALERGRTGRRDVPVPVHDVRHVLDRGGHHADLPHLRDARGRATHRDGYRPRGRHAAWPSRRRLRLRRGGVRRRGCGRGCRTRPRGRVRDRVGHRERRSATSRHRAGVLRGARSVIVAYALGVVLTLAVVAVSAWRVSR